VAISGKRLFTSESVTEGHPDKIADQISDPILDAILAQDPHGRVACESLVTTGLAVIAGEISTDCYVDFPKVVRKTIADIGYTRAKYGFDYETCAVISTIDEQSADIAQGVDTGGAGDQGLMFGYASNETPEYMPTPIMLAHKLTQRLAEARKEGELDWLRPDGKSQVTIEYDGRKPIRVDTVVVSCQHSPSISNEELRRQVIERIVMPVIPDNLKNDEITFHINPTGRFVVGGPQGDCGLTGRKIIVDTYGGHGSHGGGAFSGKDPSKVDRSASYMARYMAKNVVAAGMADQVEIQMAYAIGVAEPVSLMVNTLDTGKLPETQIEAILTNSFALRSLRAGVHLGAYRLRRRSAQSRVALRGRMVARRRRDRSRQIMFSNQI